MKTSAIIVAAFLLANPASAGNFTSQNQSKCESISKTAKTIMEARQSGVGMSKMMRLLRENAESVSYEVLEKVVANAYELPNWSTEKRQQESIQDFGDKWYRVCYVILSENEE